MRASLDRALADWRWGRRCGYPRCCIAMYCWDSLWSLPPSLTRAVAQGVDGPDPACDRVPCGIFHHAGSHLSTRARVARIARYWWHALRVIPRRDIPAQGRLRAPWHADDPPRCPTPRPGDMEQAWAELDACAHDPDLDWS